MGHLGGDRPVEPGIRNFPFRPIPSVLRRGLTMTVKLRLVGRGLLQLIHRITSSGTSLFIRRPLVSVRIVIHVPRVVITFSRRVHLFRVRCFPVGVRGTVKVNFFHNCIVVHFSISTAPQNCHQGANGDQLVPLRHAAANVLKAFPRVIRGHLFTMPRHRYILVRHLNFQEFGVFSIVRG